MATARGGVGLNRVRLLTTPSGEFRWRRVPLKLWAFINSEDKAHTFILVRKPIPRYRAGPSPTNSSKGVRRITKGCSGLKVKAAFFVVTLPAAVRGNKIECGFETSCSTFSEARPQACIKSAISKIHRRSSGHSTKEGPDPYQTILTNASRLMLG